MNMCLLSAICGKLASLICNFSPYFFFFCLLTYNISASNLSVSQDRNYVTMKSRVLHPEFRGRMVCSGLVTECLYYAILPTI
jgi:hypothetical protein